MKHRHLALVVALLLLQFLIRVYHTDIQEPYIDEGFHIVRGSFAWDFDQNPGRFSHGKVLLYYWLGLFESEPTNYLHTARNGMALWALISGAAIYAVGRKLFGSPAGLVSLGLYAVLPLAFFYERMGMADPFASGFACLVAWRSLIFAKRPTWRQGILIGVLLGLGAMAKLSMVLLPVLPLGAALIFYPWQRAGLWSQFLKRIEQVVSPLLLAAVIVVVLWLPMLIPAYFAKDSDNPYVLVNDYNLRSNAQDETGGYSAVKYWEEVKPLVLDFTSPGLWIALRLAMVFLIVRVVLIKRIEWRGTLYLFLWLAVVIGLVLSQARLVTARYMMPAAAPTTLILGAAAVGAWRLHGSTASKRFYRLGRTAISIGARLGSTAAVGAWLIGFVVPLANTSLNKPLALEDDFHRTNYIENISGYLSADDVVREGADILNNLDPAPTYIYATWNVCHLLFFYSEQPITCLPLDHFIPVLYDYLDHTVPPGEKAVLVVRGYKPFLERLALCDEKIADLSSTRVRGGNVMTLAWVQRGQCE
ncbi:MAG TPA: glycosyltransferase family 39 protein [Aggregatilineaceae bacterium]|nr:glycosyltransferase family 39 protein [Aggregatilineaceae bacterium]